MIEYNVEWHSPLTAEEVAVREAAIEALPDHPDHIQMRLYRRYLERGPTTQAVRLWWMEAGVFRVSTDSTLGDGRPADLPTLDTVISSDTAWALAAEQLHAFDPGGPYPPRHGVESAESEALYRVEEAFLGGLTSARSHRYQVESARLDGADIVGVARTTEGGTVTLRLRQFGEQGTWLCVARTRHTADSPPRLANRATFEAWEFDQAANAWVARRVEHFNSDDRRTDATTITRVGRVTSTEFAELARMPSLSAPDAIRGDGAFKTFWDFRASGGTVSHVAGEREGLTQPIPSEMLASNRAKPAGPWLWAAAGLLIATLVVLRIYKGRATGP